jgi:sterol 3beta-glucosyltransferase
MKPLLESMLPDMWSAAKDSDVIVSSGTALWGLDIAEKLSVPHILAGLQPLFSTDSFPQVLMPGWFDFGRVLNKASFSLVGSIYWQIASHSINSWRSQHLSLPKRTESFSESRQWAEQLHVLAYSPLVIPQPMDWGENVHTTGYWQTEISSDFLASGQLVDFLSLPEKPIYVGFGSMSYEDDIVDIVLEALLQTKQRGIISFSKESLKNIQVPETVLNVESIPHSWLFPQMKAAIHHGGAGTTAAALAAGIPSLAIPFFSEQPFWGRRIAEIGVSPQPIPKKDLSVSRLVEAIQELISDQQMGLNATILGQKLQKENGVGVATGLIHKYISQ